MTNTYLLLDLDCPCPDFGQERPSTSQQLIGLMSWLGVVSPKNGDVAAVVQMAVDNGLTAPEIAETLDSSVPTAYRLAARNKAWLAAARQLEALVRAGRFKGEDLFARPLGDVILTPRVRDALTRGSLSKKEMLTLARFRDYWRFEHLQRLPCFDLVGMEVLAKSLVLAGLEADFEALLTRIMRAVRKRRDGEMVECALPSAPKPAPGQRSHSAAAPRMDFMARAAAVQREFAWGSINPGRQVSPGLQA